MFNFYLLGESPVKTRAEDTVFQHLVFMRRGDSILFPCDRGTKCEKKSKMPPVILHFMVNTVRSQVEERSVLFI